MGYKGFSYNKSGWGLHMMPIGYLMIEHRLIERMVKLMRDELEKLNKGKKPDLKFIDIAIDFIRTYADKCHHGKEEDILFRDLFKKKLAYEHKSAVEELIREHKMGRAAVAKLVTAKDAYAKGNLQALKDIKGQIKWLIEFYPEHIVKEDKRSFIPFMSYFNKIEQDTMLGEFLKFDSSGVQDTYRKIVQEIEAKSCSAKKQT